MPTVFREGPYRFFFWSADSVEPPHIHVERDRHQVKFWLLPVELAGETPFADHETRRIEWLVRREQQRLLQAWYDTFR